MRPRRIRAILRLGPLLLTLTLSRALWLPGKLRAQLREISPELRRLMRRDPASLDVAPVTGSTTNVPVPRQRSAVAEQTRQQERVNTHTARKVSGHEAPTHRVIRFYLPQRLYCHIPDANASNLPAIPLGTDVDPHKPAIVDAHEPCALQDQGRLQPIVAEEAREASGHAVTERGPAMDIGVTSAVSAQSTSSASTQRLERLKDLALHMTSVVQERGQVFRRVALACALETRKRALGKGDMVRLKERWRRRVAVACACALETRQRILENAGAAVARLKKRLRVAVACVCALETRQRAWEKVFPRYVLRDVSKCV